MPESQPKPTGADASAQALTREQLLAAFRADDGHTWNALARMAMRDALRLMKKPYPVIETADLAGLCDAVVEAAAATETSKDAVFASLSKSANHFDESIDCIRVDMMLRGTKAVDMPSSHRLVLRTLAGHAKDQKCWPSRETIAGECGLSARAVDVAIIGLIEKGWLEKELRRGNDGKIRVTNEYRLMVEYGEWWSSEERKAMRRRTPPPAPPKKLTNSQ